MNFFQDNLFFKRLIIPMMVWSCMHCPAPAFSQCGFGQSPDQAIPICNEDTIYQGTINSCTPQFIPSSDHQSCFNFDPLHYYTKKPIWYRLHCYVSGTLRFLIKYNNSSDMYAWQLFDITGTTANSVYSDPNLMVRGNWANNGIDFKGTAPGSILLFGCAVDLPIIIPALNDMPTILAGHDYLLLVNHSDLTPDYGYKLVVNGGRAVIADNTIPALRNATGSCTAPQLLIRLSKNVQCSSIASDGTDFSLDYPGVSILQATTTACGNGTLTDSVMLTLSAPLPKGNYSIRIKKGTDNNTILDFCNTAVAEGNTLNFGLGNINAGIAGPDIACPNELISFTDISTGLISGWQWDLQNTNIINTQTPPPQSYPTVINNTDLNIRLVVKDAENCQDTTFHLLKLVNNCTIAVPGGFTPNKDGLNDYLYPLNAWKVRNLSFGVYDRYGQLVFYTKDYTKKWDGTLKGAGQPAGVYVWMLSYTDETGKKVSSKGFSTLVR